MILEVMLEAGGEVAVRTLQNLVLGDVHLVVHPGLLLAGGHVTALLAVVLTIARHVCRIGGHHQTVAAGR